MADPLDAGVHYAAHTAGAPAAPAGWPPGTPIDAVNGHAGGPGANADDGGTLVRAVGAAAAHGIMACGWAPLPFS